MPIKEPAQGYDCGVFPDFKTSLMFYVVMLLNCPYSELQTCCT